MMSFLAAGEVEDEVVDDVPRRPAPRRRRQRRDHLGRRDPGRRQGQAAHTVVIGCGESGILAGIRLAQAGLPFTIVEKRRRPRRHLVGEPLPRRPGRHRQPPLLLLVRARRPLERVLLPAARAARLLRRASSTSTALGPHCRFGTEVTGAPLGRGARGAGRSSSQTADGADEALDARFVISARRRAEPARSCPRSRAWTTSPARRSTPPAGRTRLDITGTAVRARRRRRQRLPDRADDRRRGRRP